jgi:hypothetical protein
MFFFAAANIKNIGHNLSLERKNVILLYEQN